MDPTPRFDTTLLDRLTAALSIQFGAEACIVVAKAADQALDVHQLCMALATRLPPSERARFLDGTRDLRDPAPARPLTPALLAQAARRLAEHIGPIARVLVAREARVASSPADLYARLAQHIREHAARQAFLSGAPR